MFLTFVTSAWSFIFPFIPKGYYQQWYGGTNHQINNYTDFPVLPGSISSDLICPLIAGIRGILLCSTGATQNPVYGPIPKKLIEYTVKCSYVNPPAIYEEYGGRVICMNYLYVQKDNVGEVCAPETGVPFCLYMNLEDSSDEYFPGYVGYHSNPQNSSSTTLNIIPAKSAPWNCCDEYIYWNPSEGPSLNLTLTKALFINSDKEHVVEGTYLGEMISYYKPPPGLNSYYVDGTAGMYYVNDGSKDKKEGKICDDHGSGYKLKCYYLIPRDQMVKLMLFNYD